MGESCVRRALAERDKGGVDDFKCLSILKLHPLELGFAPAKAAHAILALAAHQREGKTKKSHALPLRWTESSFCQAGGSDGGGELFS